MGDLDDNEEITNSQIRQIPSYAGLNQSLSGKLSQMTAQLPQVEKLQDQVNQLLKKLLKKRQELNVVCRNYGNVNELYEGEKKKTDNLTKLIEKKDEEMKLIEKKLFEVKTNERLQDSLNQQKKNMFI